MKKSLALSAFAIVVSMAMPVFAADAVKTVAPVPPAALPIGMSASDHSVPIPVSQIHKDMNNAGLYDPAMNKMHESMMVVKNTGDADVDFVNGMIPHHQGAIDMAKIVIEKGNDPEIRALAEGIVKAQESEIAMMSKWLETHKPKK